MRISFLVLFVVVVVSFVTFTEAKRAMILSGGGAKGAYQLGALQYLCETDYKNSWDMVIGSSIGAMNAVALAQYQKHEFCSKGVKTLNDFWKSIKEKDDVFESWNWLTFGECLNPINFLSIANGWYKKGGMCSTEPGAKKMQAAVSASRIANSNLQLFVSASALNDTTRPYWFSNKSPNVIDYALASGALAPVFPPKKVNGMYYIDGGYFSNVPILKALEEGATEIYVFLLSPLGNQADEKKAFEALAAGKFGPVTASHFVDVFTRQLLLHSELRTACLERPEVSIRAIIPTTNIGETTGFSADEISRMMKEGYTQASRVGFEDLCAAASRLSGPIGKEYIEIMDIRAQANVHVDKTVVLNVGIGVGGALIGGFAVFAFLNKKRKVQHDNAFFEIPAPEK